MMDSKDIFTGLVLILIVAGLGFSLVKLNDLSARNDAISRELESLKTSKISTVPQEATVIDAYNKVAPSVVFITSTILTFDFRRQVVPQEGVGSGAIVSSEGYILTNNHVVEGAEFITVSLGDGEEIEAELIGTDPSHDLAVIKIPQDDLPVAEMGNSEGLEIGQSVVAIGNPFSLERTATVGVISALERTLEAEDGGLMTGLIQTDAAVNPGNSGGPLVNLNGEIIGINTAIISPSGGSVGIGFAIPINLAKRVMEELITRGKVANPFMGLFVASVEELPVENLGISVDSGVLIVDLAVGGPAEKAGLKGSDREVRVGRVRYPAGGDIIIGINDYSIRTAEDLIIFIAGKSVGDEVEVTFVRDGDVQTTTVVLEELP